MAHVSPLRHGKVESRLSSFPGLKIQTWATLPSTQFSNSYGCWSYDAFANRTMEAVSTTPCGSSPTPSSWAHYNVTNSNRMDATSQNTNQANGYDAAGDVTYDGINTYLYDGEGRICAVASATVNGLTTYTGYLYDADGARVAKGSIQNWGSCDPAVNGFQTTKDYILGPGGEQVTEMGMDANNSMAWARTNVWIGGKLMAAYDPDGLHFYLDDPLGTRRVQTDAQGVVEQNCSSLPFGDAESCTAGYLFTGKERDTESGNDYFGDRYYSAGMGRWMSPDWSSNPVSIPFARLDDPQTLNRYSYVGNNPLNRFDWYGHSKDCGGGGDPSVVCIVTTLIDKIKSWFSGGGSGGSGGCTGTCLAPNPDDSLPRGYSTHRIVPNYRFRAPDYYSFSLAGGFVNPSVQYVPKTGNWFASGGLSAPATKPLGVMATAGWSLSGRPEDYLRAKGFAGCAAYGAAACLGYSPGGGGWAFEAGLGTPTVGASAAYAEGWDSITQAFYQAAPVEPTWTIPYDGLVFPDPQDPSQ